MNATTAIEYMRKTGKSVVAQSTPPWIKDPNWVKIKYTLFNDKIILSIDSRTIDIQSNEEWQMWWWNFCYNNSTNQTELIPYEC